MTYKIDTFRYLTWRLAQIGLEKDCLAKYQANVTERDISSWCQPPGLALGQLSKVGKCALSYAGCHTDMTLDVTCVEVLI